LLSEELIEELIALVRTAAVQQQLDWQEPGYAFPGDEPGRPAYWRVYSEHGWLGGPHIYAEVDASSRRILLLEERGWETLGGASSTP
jgi:hypothetical protein